MSKEEPILKVKDFLQEVRIRKNPDKNDDYILETNGFWCVNLDIGERNSLNAVRLYKRALDEVAKLKNE